MHDKDCSGGEKGGRCRARDSVSVDLVHHGELCALKCRACPSKQDAI